MTNPLHVEAPEGVPFIDATREFDAPVEAVFRAHRDPDLVTRWLGPGKYRMDLGSWDFTSGGSWAYTHTGPDGDEYRFRGVFHTVRENEFAIQTFEFEGYPDVVAIESMTFEDLGDGRSRLRLHSTYPSVESRDGMVASGMESGMSEGYRRLDDVLAS
jgi:uncharacterized protein YndB with AHSA1/START domain